MADGDSGLAVVIEAIVFEDSVFDPPAEEQADAAVPDRPAVADGGRAAAASGMKAEVGVSGAGAIFHGRTVALLKADPVAVVVFNCAAGDPRAVAAVQEDARAPAPIEIGVVFLVSLDREVFDRRPLDAIAADHRKRGCRPGVA